MSYLKLRRKDKIFTKISKRRGNRNQKRKGVIFVSDLHPVHRKSSTGGRYHKKPTKSVRYIASIENFCNTNRVFVNKHFTSVIKLNHKFSLFNDPDFVLLKLVNLLIHAKTYERPPVIKYDGSVSFGAVHLLDNLSWEISRRRRWKFRYKNLPESDAAIVSNLKSVNSSEVENEYEYMINNRIRINRGEQLGNQAYKVKATSITAMIEKAIAETKGDENYQLPLPIHGAIKSTIGEQFDNIHQHSTEADFGTICCLYNKTSQEVTLLIYNFGNTIAQTILSSELHNDLAIGIYSLLSRHRSLNERFLNKFSPENIVTLLSLQEGVSSKLKEDNSRGHGLLDFVDKCFQLTEDCKVTLISGKTAIKLDKRYRIRDGLLFGKNRRIISLNKSNDLFERPDPQYLKNIAVHFNGVLIETIIPLKDV